MQLFQDLNTSHVKVKLKKKNKKKAKVVDLNTSHVKVKRNSAIKYGRNKSI